MSTVMLVDDEPDVLEGLSLSLRHPERTLLRATSGPEARELFKHNFIDVVVSDERMPGESGCAFLSWVAENHPDTVRLLLTGSATVDVAIQAVNGGKIFQFLTKPCAPAQIRGAVGAAEKMGAQARATSALVHAAAQHARVAECAAPQRLGSLGPARDAREIDFELQLTEAERAALSERQIEVAALVAQGVRVAQVAKQLFVSQHTVRNHLKAIFAKLDIHSQAELMERATRARRSTS